jgi:hypothetical protein
MKLISNKLLKISVDPWSVPADPAVPLGLTISTPVLVFGCKSLNQCLMAASDTVPAILISQPTGCPFWRTAGNMQWDPVVMALSLKAWKLTMSLKLQRSLMVFLLSRSGLKPILFHFSHRLAIPTSYSWHMLFVVRRWFLLLLLYFRIINLPLLVILFAPLNPILGCLKKWPCVSGNKIRGENICLMITHDHCSKTNNHCSWLCWKEIGLHVLLMLVHPLSVMILIMPLSWHDIMITIVHGFVKIWTPCPCSHACSSPVCDDNDHAPVLAWCDNHCSWLYQRKLNLI